MLLEVGPEGIGDAFEPGLDGPTDLSHTDLLVWQPRLARPAMAPHTARSAQAGTGARLDCVARATSWTKRTTKKRATDTPAMVAPAAVP